MYEAEVDPRLHVFRVVVVDDSAACRRAATRALRARHTPIDLVLLASGEEALAHLEHHTADFVVMDVHMPGVDGITACRAIKDKHAIQIALVSGDMSADVRLAAATAGADFLLSKPYDIAGLIDAGLDRRAVCSPVGARAVQLLTSAQIEIARNIARSLARQYATFLSREDIDGLAFLGLCEAAARYDATRHEVFIAFAAARVRGAVLDAVRKQGTKSRAHYKTSFDQASATVLAEGTGVTNIEDLPSPDVPAIATLQLNEQYERLELARQVLEPVEAQVIALHYERGLSLAAIAQELGLTGSRVVHIHTRALAQLRDLVAD
jgi:RNA polymerase sigma factor for flagellar operon FliA